ncbi:MAG: NAD(P)/FAD-dependent oxidoreductase [Caulobacterales bacterium]
MAVVDSLSEDAIRTIENDEAFVRAALDTADLNALRLTLLQLTGDESLARMRVERTIIWCGALYNHTLAPEHEDEVKEKAFAFLRGAAKSRAKFPAPSKEEVRRIGDLFGEPPMSDETLRYAIEEMAFVHFPRELHWSKKPDDKPLADYNVLVIGAGIGGIAAAIQLERMGIPYQVIDRQQDFGGVWNQNRYPEVRVDSPSLIYQYKFEPYPWKEKFASGAESQGYLRHCAEKYGITEKVSFSVEMLGAEWDERSKRWIAHIRDKGSERKVSARFIISAAGIFNNPRLPDIPGIGDFKGKAFHTTDWDHSFDVSGKRVALIGNGSTGVQLMPHLARSAKSLTVFQRTAGWITPLEGYRNRFPKAERWLIDNFPYYWNWFSFSMFWLNSKLAGLQDIDPEWQKAGGKINERNDATRQGFEDYIRSKLAGRPDLIEKSMPKYPPMARRPIVDNGWYDALIQDNVELVTDKIECITPEGVRLTSGKAYDFDLIVLAGGFDLRRYLSPVNYTGRNGVTLNDLWAEDGPRAHIGMTLPGFPNLFIMYGPNSQPRAGSHYSASEIWTRYMLKAILAVIESGADTIEVTHEAFDKYNDLIDRRAKNLIWENYGQGGYYLTEAGRSLINCPLEAVEYHAYLTDIDFNEFRLA